MTGSRFICVSANDPISFLLVTEQYLIVYAYQIFFIHSSVVGHLCWFHVLVIVNSAAMNIWVHMSLSVLISSVCMPSSGIAGSYGQKMIVLIITFAFNYIKLYLCN